jgi:hypothetical protein
MGSLRRRAAFGLLRRHLRRTYRRIVWLGPFEPPPADRPAVLVANHHLFHDGQVLAYVTFAALGRRPLVWMDELDRFPFLSTLGAMPFPTSDPGTRVRTIRRTARLMRERPDVVLTYFPEGTLHSVDEGVLALPPDRLHRLARVLPPAMWWPVVLCAGDWHEATPTAYLWGAAASTRPLEDPALELARLLSRRPDSAGQTVLLEGRPGPHERWDFSRSFPRRIRG